MTDTPASPTETAAPDLVADYLADLLRSMSSLAAAADLPESAKALRGVLAVVHEERLGAALRGENIVRKAASDG